MSFIVLGQHRSGTSFFLDLLRHHPEVDTINEPFSIHVDFFRNCESVWTENDYKKNIFHEQLTDRGNICLYIKNLNKWLNHSFPNIRGFKETALFEKYFWLKKSINIDKTIIVIRDPRAFINSVLKRNLHNSWWDYKLRIEKYYINENIHKETFNNDIFLCASIWKMRMKHILNIMDKEECLIVKLEDLLRGNFETLENIMNYLNLTIHNDQYLFLKETSGESRNSTYSNFRKKEDVLDEWKKRINGETLKHVEKYLEYELNFFNYK